MSHKRTRFKSDAQHAAYITYGDSHTNTVVTLYPQNVQFARDAGIPRSVDGPREIYPSRCVSSSSSSSVAVQRLASTCSSMALLGLRVSHNRYTGRNYNIVREICSLVYVWLT
eukprot:8061997-Pyramimonas_sp.AAC.1